jgi:hypothetical protein
MLAYSARHGCTRGFSLRWRTSKIENQYPELSGLVAGAPEGEEIIDHGKNGSHTQAIRLEISGYEPANLP